MAGLTDYAEQKALEHFLRGTIYTPAAQIYAGLSTNAPSDVGAGGTEVSTGGYARKAVGFGSFAGRQIGSSADLLWTAGADWGPVTTLTLHDHPTAGSMLAFGPISPIPTVNNGQTVPIAAGQLVVELLKYGPWLAQRILELLFKNTAHSSISSSIYGHACSIAPNNEGVGAVVLANGDYTPKLAGFAAYSGGRCGLSGDVDFVVSAATPWGPIPAIMWRDGVSPTASNFLEVTAISPIPNVTLGQPFSLKAADTYFGLD